MIIYNVTVSVQEDIELDWLNWMKHHHIPKVMSCGIFSKSHLNRLINNNELTYTVSYFCNNIKEFHEYEINFAPSFSPIST